MEKRKYYKLIVKNRIKYFLKNKYLFKVIALILVVLIVLKDKFIVKESIYDENMNEFTGIIYKMKVKDNKTTLYINSSEDLVVSYDGLLNELSIGDKVLIYGTLYKPNKNTVFNLFNYQEYLLNKNIFYIVRASEVKKIANNTNVLYEIKKIINKRIDNIKYSNEYLKVFILGDTSSFDDSVMESFRNNGVSHLFSISGMHISLFASFILYILKKVSYNNYYNYLVVIFCLLFYTLLVGSSPSAIRSLVMYILFTINKLFKLDIKKIDIMMIVLIIILLINNNYLFEMSFQYSYIISLSLILFRENIAKINNKFLKSLYISWICFWVSFPICIYNFYQVNFLSIILNIYLIPFVSTIIFPLSLISFMIPKMSFILNIFIYILQNISLFVSNLEIGLCNFSKISIIFIFIYYIFIFISLKWNKYIYLLLIVLIHKNINYFDSSFKVIMLDVGQGDSILIKYPYNMGNILIDTGGNSNSDYEIVGNKTIPYLDSIGINKINYLILSHGDYDHMGEAINLINNFKVENVVLNCGDYNTLENELISLLDKKKIPYYSCIKELGIDKYQLQFLNTGIYDNENDNSSVIYTKINNYKFLFMGDAGIDKESDILEKYNIYDVDILKVGHHGSKTSSGEKFIGKINPKYSIISVGKNNRYGHPNNSVLDNLGNSKIYRTDQDGSIMFRIKNNKLQIETCVP